MMQPWGKDPRRPPCVYAPGRSSVDLSADDIIRLIVSLNDGHRLELAVVVARGGAAARQRHERAVGVGRVIEPGAEVIVVRAQTAAALQLVNTHDTLISLSHTHTHTHTHTDVRTIVYTGVYCK